ncbi:MULTISPECIES: ABC transporter ATP-binding protein [Bradyrhizobium]|jgi:branched-chain amino acid transport system ATP-binding protein|uniref:ABC-type branched-subunit amino acid transport system ATPase component n=1 Tax=Bradyrhizobium elkanii TaxID=29448 RepID=A0A8I1Y929_BRAEL|nr:MULTISPECIES: ABC transporter ATP-binding protein [Bradyrhizobium]MBP1294495.1 ABC-type branched-subunit amino acid transport system ATPase component [Bradyrhizobium elkanii]MCP1925121.1 ABC-type branched-subunit amino acid transport system ATPase component [Bradyrhizobium elkanii]MCS3477390.1 ABC-type branched-subunit amino acid transport system ATPase component [Bradyrhizobium elkanii]MCS3584125.1 ABC-type branched-subunit amino acid transport system ATPase component [Bradyrhizobium elkani
MTAECTVRTDGGALLEVAAISKRFGGLHVFDNVSFAIPPGDVLGVIGPNGAGKTTLINVICGMLPPTTGRVRLDGKDMTDKPLHAVSRMGIIRSFQQTNTFRTASVRENISRVLRFSGSGPGWESVAPLIDEFELEPQLDEQSDKLPYGLQKMLGLILACAARPKVLLLDEPAAGLERRERLRVDAFVRHVKTELGCGVLIVEHDMDLVRRLCPRILVLDSGRVLAEGAPAEVLARKDVIDAYLGSVDEEAA